MKNKSCNLNSGDSLSIKHNIRPTQCISYNLEPVGFRGVLHMNMAVFLEVPFWRFALNKWDSEKVQLDQLDSHGLDDAADSAGEAFLWEPTIAPYFISQ